jgi:hypothetical protein
VAWADPRVGVRNILMQRNITRAKQMADAKLAPAERQAGRSVENYLQRIGLSDRQQAERMARR